MIRTVTAARMREADRKAIEDYEIPGLILMENAGRGAAELAVQMNPDRGPVAIFAGKGNNGGDAFVIARHLYNKHYPVDVFLLARKDEIKPPGDAGVNLNIALKMDIPVKEILEEGEIQSLDLSSYSLVVDGIFGTGLSGEVGGRYRSAIERINSSMKPVLAVDIPSGLSADEGRPLGVAVRAAKTATFGAAKIGFTAPDASEYVGNLHVIEISIPRTVLETM